MGRRRSQAYTLILMAVASVGCKSKTIEIPANVLPSIALTVFPDVDLDAGLDGGLNEALGTAFQAAPWQQAFFDGQPEEADPDASALVALAPRYVRVQAYDSPEQSSSPVAWDFSELDSIVQPLLRLNATVVLQIFADDQNQRSVLPDPSHFDAFATYCAGIVSYYNSDAGLRLDDGGTTRSDAGRPIQWWSLFGDPNSLLPSGKPLDEGALGEQYAQMYSRSVAAMLQVDPNLKFAAPEFNDCTDTPSECLLDGGFLDSFLAATADAGSDGGKTPIHALSVHMFSSAAAIAPGAFCDDKFRLATDLQIFASVPTFGDDARTLRDLLKRAGRSGTWVWVTQNQVNSDTPTTDNPPFSAHCGNVPEGTFIADERGTNPFFAAWRPYLFARLARAGADALFQWQYTAGHCPGPDAPCSQSDAADTDIQNAEVDYNSGNTYLSYWVDRELASKFPADAGLAILKTTLDPENAVDDIETLAARRLDGTHMTTVVMVANHAVADAGDYNGPGSKHTVVVNLEPLVAGSGADWSVSKLAIDEKTDSDAGPHEVPGAGVPPGQTFVPIDFEGYGVTFLTVCSPACAP